MHLYSIYVYCVYIYIHMFTYVFIYTYVHLAEVYLCKWHWHLCKSRKLGCLWGLSFASSLAYMVGWESLMKVLKEEVIH